MKKISKFYFEDLLYIDTRKFKGIIMPGTDLTELYPKKWTIEI